MLARNTPDNLISELNKIADSNYSNGDNFNDWFLKANRQSLLLRNIDQLVLMMDKIYNINIYNNRFLNDWINSFHKQIDHSMPSQVKFALDAINHFQHKVEIEFLDSASSILHKKIQIASGETCGEVLFILTKLNYRPAEEILAALSHKALSECDTNNSLLLKVIQSVAKLDCTDRSILTSIIDQVNIKYSEFNNRQLINSAFYLSMIKVNTYNEPNIVQLIDNIVNRIDHASIDNIKGKHQILQIKVAGCETLEIPDPLWNEEVKNEVLKQVNNSFTQTKVENAIKRRYAKFASIESEVWLPEMAASVDILLTCRYIAQHGVRLATQVDGPNHWYINHNHSTASKNATTRFNSALAEVSHIALLRIDYFEDKDCFLSTIDHRLAKENAKFLIEQELTISSKPIEASGEKMHVQRDLLDQGAVTNELLTSNKVSIAEPIAGNDSKRTKSKSSKNESQTKKTDNWYAARAHEEITKCNYSQAQLWLEEFRAERGQDKLTEFITKQFNGKSLINESINSITKTKFHPLYFIDFINFLISNGDLGKLTGNYDDALIKLISLSKDTHESQTYIAITDFLLMNGIRLDNISGQAVIQLYMSTLNEYGNISVLDACLNHIPHSKMKTELIEITFIRSAMTRDSKKVDYLLEKGVDHNAFHPTEFIEVINMAISGLYIEDSKLSNKEPDKAKKEKIISSLCAGLYHNGKSKPKTYIGDVLRDYRPKCGVHEQYEEHLGRGTSALHSAVHAQSIETTQILLNRGANVNTLNRFGMSPLLTSLNKSLDETIPLLLLKHNANTNIVSSIGFNALFLATKNGSANLVEYILRKGNVDININTTSIFYQNSSGTLDASNVTPLMVSSLLGHKKILEHLIEAGAALDMKDSLGNTAAKYSSRKIFNMLLIAGASMPADNIKFTDLVQAFHTDPLAYIKASDASPTIKAMGFSKLYFQNQISKPQINQALTELIIYSSDQHHLQKIVKINNEVDQHIGHEVSSCINDLLGRCNLSFVQRIENSATKGHGIN